jgi:ADP-ribosylglycohydrolase
MLLLVERPEYEKSALAAKGDFARGVRLTVNHSGGANSTGAIVGNILGAVPGEWVERAELRELVKGMGEGIMAVGRVLIEKN